jgi:DNA-directed RNA polymerase specialized sigma24 family protein
MGSGRIPTIKIEGKTIREISAETGVREATIRARMFPGCTIKDLVGRKTDGRAGGAILIDGMTLGEISAATGISKHTLYWRYKHGRADFEALTSGRYRVRIPRK